MKQLSTLLFLMIINYGFAQLNPSFAKEKMSFQTQFQKAQFDNPGIAADYEFEITKNPLTNEVPYQKRYEAMEQTRQILNQRSAIGGVEWLERGPNNISGRTRAIMFDPNFASNQKVWAGGISGGLWYNTDVENNGAWQSVNDFWENIAISCLAFDPSDTQNFYAGTGEGWTNSSVRGAGIWKSSNAGTSWSRLESTNNTNFNYIQSIKVSSSGRVFASTNSGLYYSDNDGTSWTEALEGFFGDIELTSDGTIYAASGKAYMDGTVYKSTNDGDSWADLMITTDFTERTELASAPSNANVIYAVSSVGTNVSWFKKSINAGETWTDLSIPMYLDQWCSVSSFDFTRGQAWYDLIMSVNPEDEEVVYVGGIDWHKTTDGGENWEGVSYWTGSCADYVHADQHAMAFFPNDPSKALVGCDGGIYLINQMTSGFNAELHVNNNYNVTQFYGCAMENEPGSNYMLAGAQDNGTQRFTQAGLNTTSQATGGDGGFCFIDQDNSQIQISSYVYNNWRLSLNGGQSFDNYPSTENGSFINPGAYDSETNILYASSSADSLFVSDIMNDGAFGNYLPIENGIGDDRISAVKVSPYSEHVIYVGTRNGQAYRITNANTNPTASNLTLPNSFPIGNISCIDLGENEDDIILTSSSYGVKSVFRTTNGGTNWTDIEYNLPDMPVRGCLYNPENTQQILLATETGVWSINDISTETEWVPSNSGLANVRCDQLVYRSTDRLVAVATYGRGLFTSDIFASLDPYANFEVNSELTCLTDTIFFTDISTKNPNSWQWSITPNNFSFLNGTNANSQNPIVQFNQIGNYSVELTATNADGFGHIVKNNFIQVNEDCPYLMADELVYACEGIFYDSGADHPYANGLDYTMTFSPSNANPNAFIIMDFTLFDVEFNNSCFYDYIKIYDGPDTSYPFLGRYCGTDSPGEVTASNRSLTFKFHSDGASAGEGWEANISCEISDAINEYEASSTIKVFPNPAKDKIQIEMTEQDENTKLEIIDLMGRTMHKSLLKQNSSIDISNLKAGVYILKFSSESNTVQQSLIIE